MITMTPQTEAMLAMKSTSKRASANKDADVAAVHALTQAAVHVELFTIPLYMTSMYSIQGMHQITGKNDFYEGRLWPGASTSVLKENAAHDQYQQPDSPSPAPAKGAVDNDNFYNKKSFNTIFSVFIQEMLHLQLAANICTALNRKADGTINAFDPQFTGAPLQKKIREVIDPETKQVQKFENAWTCYGPDVTTIPHILDLADLKSEKVFGDDYLALDEIKVRLGALDINSISLFMAIEAPEEKVLNHLKEDKKSKYFPEAPFSSDIWQASYTENELPVFGSISHMYSCLVRYLNIEYDDGTNLFETVFNDRSAQQDLFNFSDRKGGQGHSGHPCAEFSDMGELTVTAADPENAKRQIFNMINGITEQGEGGSIVNETTLKATKDTLSPDDTVKDRYQPDRYALEADYPSYDDKGQRCPHSADAQARSIGGEHDHFARFAEIATYVAEKKVTTWADWHADPDNRWTADMLVTDPSYLETASKYNIPHPEDVATALNNLKFRDFSFDGTQSPVQSTISEKNLEMFSHVAAGSIAGITTVLDRFWMYRDFIGRGGSEIKEEDYEAHNVDLEKDPYSKYKATTPTEFPFPSMGGSGDRISICWAIFGVAPDLSLGAFPRESGIIPEGQKSPVNHACQGLGFNPDGSQNMENVCATKGIFHTCKGSNSCAGEGGCGYVHDAHQGGGNCGSSGPGNGNVSAPGGNKCGSLGGCAVPMSDSQIMPDGGTIELFRLNHHTDDKGFETLGSMPYEQGDGVYETAWRAYQSVLHDTVLTKEQMKDKPAPAPSDLRLAFPPST